MVKNIIYFDYVLTILFYVSAESVSVDAIKNALKLYQKWEVLDCHSEKKLRLYYLREDQDEIESVRILYQRVNKFRQ